MDNHRNKRAEDHEQKLQNPNYPNQMKTQEMDEINSSNRSSIQIQIKLENSVSRME